MADVPRSIQPTRRWIPGARITAIVGGGASAANWFNVLADSVDKGAFSLELAHQIACDSEISLVDIRRSDEWAHAGVVAPAIPIDMRRKDFPDVL